MPWSIAKVNSENHRRSKLAAPDCPERLLTRKIRTGNELVRLPGSAEDAGAWLVKHEPLTILPPATTLRL
jgi:hypothetical protein